MAANNQVVSDSCPLHARSAGFWPVNPGDLETIDYAMTNSTVYVKGDLVVSSSGAAVDAAAAAPSATLLGVVAHGGGSLVTAENANQKLTIWLLDMIHRWWVIASTGTAAEADLDTLADFDGADGVNMDASPSTGGGEWGFKPLQVDDTNNCVMGVFRKA